MQTLYRIEFFDRDFSYKNHQPIPEPTLEHDYIALSESTISLPFPFPVKSGWYAQVFRGSDVVYQGVVSSANDPQINMQVRLRPLLSLLDIQLYKSPSGFSKNAEGWITSAIKQELVSTADTVQKVPGLIVNQISTSSCPTTPEGNVHGLWSVITAALEQSRIALDAILLPQAKKIIITVARNTHAAVNIESELPGITVKTFSVAEKNAVNKVSVYNKDDATQYKDFYADDYAPPTVKVIREISLGSDDKFDQKAAETAASLLNTDKFDNCIELTFNDNCRVMPDMSIGQQARIIRRGVAYTAILTGVTTKGAQKTYTFGRRRRELTKKIRLELKST